MKKLGFKYNIAGAKALLAANGYKDTNGDGFVENKNGSRTFCGNPWAVDSEDNPGCCFPEDGDSGRIMRFYPCE